MKAVPEKRKSPLYPETLTLIRWTRAPTHSRTGPRISHYNSDPICLTAMQAV
jgi:hypothetical protein